MSVPDRSDSPGGVAAWAARIRPHLERTVAGIIAAGRELLEAKAELPHGDFGPLLDELGLSRRMAQRFMAVAAHPVLGNASPATHLPPSVTVLDELTRMPADELADALERGDIGPSTTRREAAELVRGATDEHLVADAIAARKAAEAAERRIYGVSLTEVDDNERLRILRAAVDAAEASGDSIAHYKALDALIDHADLVALEGRIQMGLKKAEAAVTILRSVAADTKWLDELSQTDLQAVIDEATRAGNHATAITAKSLLRLAGLVDDGPTGEATS
jgi:hypothetical protein